MQSPSMAGHLIRRLNQKSTQVFARRMATAGFDLTSVQFSAMDAIRSFPGIDQAGLAERIGYDRATIGGVVDRLVQKGYVARTVSQRDRRARVLVLSNRGASVLETVLPLVRDLQRDILDPLTEDERAVFMALARKALGGAMGDPSGSAPSTQP